MRTCLNRLAPVSQNPHCSCDRKPSRITLPLPGAGRVDQDPASLVLPGPGSAHFMPTRFLFDKIFPASGVGMLCACAGASRPRPRPVSGSRPPPASIHQLPGRNRANFLHSLPFTSFLLEGFCPKKNPGGSNSSGVPRLAMTRVLPGKVFHHTNDARTPPQVPHSQNRR